MDVVWCEVILFGSVVGVLVLGGLNWIAHLMVGVGLELCMCGGDVQ